MSDAPPAAAKPGPSVRDQLTPFVQVVPHQRALGMFFVSLEGGRGTLGIPYGERWVGNVETKVLHGGAVTSLMDATCGMAVFIALGGTHRIATLELRIDYLRPATPGEPVHASAECLKVTRNVAFVRCDAFHPGDPTDRIAVATGTFMIFRSEPTHVKGAKRQKPVMPGPPEAAARPDATEVAASDPAPDAVPRPSGSLVELLARAKRGEISPTLPGLLPYAETLGITFAADGEGDERVLTATMRYSEDLVGNPTLPALHGGTLGGLLETTAIIEAMWRAETAVLPKIVSITVDYLRSARARDTFARARVVKRGRRVLSVHAEAWQEDASKPVATAHVHLLVMGQEAGEGSGG